MDGIVDGVFDHGYSLTLCPQLLGERPLDAISDGRFDGLVWYSSQPTAMSRKILADSDVPLVVIHSRLQDVDDLHPCVICDNEQGIGLAVEHLVELGHREIGFAIEVNPTTTEELERQRAFFKHMERVGYPRTDRDLIEVQPNGDGISDYLRAPRHTAIIAYHDGLAGLFLLQAPEHGLTIPQDLSIVGFDSTSFCREMRPSLTSVHQPLQEMGKKAIELLIPLINGEADRIEEAVLPCRLDIRESTATPKRAHQ